MSKTLFCLVEWLNGKPMLDGMKYFKTKQKCFDYAMSLPTFEAGLNTEKTIITIEPGVKSTSESLEDRR